MTTLIPLQVRAYLAGGLAHAAPWGVALDGLLAAELWADHKATARAHGQPVPDLHATDNPIDLPLPLARCGEATGLWHWAATVAFPDTTHPGTPPDVHTRTSTLDHRHAEHTAVYLPPRISDRRGRYRARHMPLLVTPTVSVSWTAVGDPDRIATLLQPIAAIGKARSHGEGRVLSWHITARPDLDPWAAAHLHPDGTLGRPTPPACLHGRPPVPDSGTGTAGLRPPYMHRARQHPLHLPAVLDRVP